jgi:Ran GTPase-activating protein (RanGAP) involved in mRNA processing and transport
MSGWFLSTTSLMPPLPPPWLDELCQRLVGNEPTFTTVNVTHPRIDDVFAKLFAKALQENTTVTTLILSCFAMVDDGAFALGTVVGAHAHIQTLQLRDLFHARNTCILFQTLLPNTTLQELSMRHCQICPVAAQAICKYLRANTNLQEVRFVDCQFGGDDSNSLQIICEGLQESCCLQRLYFVNTEIGAAGAQHISDMLAAPNTSLRELYLGENGFGDSGVATLAQGVLKNKSLRLLDLRANGITAQGAMSLQGIISRSEYLTSLQLGNNLLGNYGAAAIGRGLQSYACVLKQLDLSENEIDSQGVQRFASMLRVNESLQELNLSINPAGNEGLTAVAHALVTNRTLRCLTIRRNGITDEGAIAFAKLLAKMSGLKELIMNKNSITSVGSSALLEALQSNAEIEYMNVEDKPSEPASKEILYWLRLNKAGRRIFRHANVPCSLWPRIYARLSNDPVALFYFIQQRPEIFSVSTPYIQKKRKIPPEQQTAELI